MRPSHLTFPLRNRISGVDMLTGVGSRAHSGTRGPIPPAPSALPFSGSVARTASPGATRASPVPGIALSCGQTAVRLPGTGARPSRGPLPSCVPLPPRLTPVPVPPGPVTRPPPTPRLGALTKRATPRYPVSELTSTCVSIRKHHGFTFKIAFLPCRRGI